MFMIKRVQTRRSSLHYTASINFFRHYTAGINFFRHYTAGINFFRHYTAGINFFRHYTADINFFRHYTAGINCWLVRVSLFIELGCPRDLGTGPWHFYDK